MTDFLPLLLLLTIVVSSAVLAAIGIDKGGSESDSKRQKRGGDFSLLEALFQEISDVACECEASLEETKNIVHGRQS